MNKKTEYVLLVVLMILVLSLAPAGYFIGYQKAIRDMNEEQAILFQETAFEVVISFSCIGHDNFTYVNLYVHNSSTIFKIGDSTILEIAQVPLQSYCNSMFGSHQQFATELAMTYSISVLQQMIFCIYSPDGNHNWTCYGRSMQLAEIHGHRYNYNTGEFVLYNSLYLVGGGPDFMLLLQIEHWGDLS